jgi:hypothetical protein
MLVATLITLAALGASDADLQPSALRLMVSCVVALLTPLFWPGIAATQKGTALRVLGWSLAATVLAALALAAFGTNRQSLPRVLEVCAMLLIVLVGANAAAAFLESRWLGSSIGAPVSREMAGRSAALALAFLGSLPLWLGPAAETLSSQHEWTIDATLSVSPLVHLAVASGNDLMRNQWFYEHSNLASLQFEYPRLDVIAWSYTLVLLALGISAMTFWRNRSPIRGAAFADRTLEKRP